MITAYDYVGLHLDGRSTPWRGVVQVCNEQGLLGCTSRAQGPSGDKVGPR
jgi:hypothetical protein